MRLYPSIPNRIWVGKVDSTAVTTSDALSLAFGLVATVLAVLAILATLYLRHTRTIPPSSQDVEMQPMIQNVNSNANEQEAALRAFEMVLGLFRREA
ncbi:hypothetical protein BKA61DRAFT_676115 [Leptodontidium sp. MPI-SDFR-AT-0119]|nr:hypothetical protein BKA61DRAFT_676115 [Leptodontidium sp. MPI-SDFR-AT-0119]